LVDHPLRDGRGGDLDMGADVSDDKEPCGGNMMQAIYDAATGTLKIHGEPGPFGAQLEARLDRHGQVIPLAGVKFGVEVTIRAWIETPHRTVEDVVGFTAPDAPVAEDQMEDHEG
jgi:hypothetical protein